jgi:hypothetical protein
VANERRKLKMALGLNLDDNSGSFTKIVPAAKWDAKYGKLLVVDKSPSPDTGKWEAEDIEVAAGAKIVIDMENILIGFINFKPYSAVWAKVGEKKPAPPSADHKPAVRIPMFFKEHGVREMTPTSKTVQRAFDSLHDEYLAQAQAHPGKLPVVTVKGSKVIKMKTKEGEAKFKAPDWAITGWVDRPAGFEVQEQVEAPKPTAKQVLAQVEQEGLDEF